MSSLLLPISALIAGLSLWLALRAYRHNRLRQQTISQLLDAADALETRLRAARAEIEAVAGDDGNPVLTAMQELLRQRLWLQEHAQLATLQTLQQMRISMDAARGRIERQLQQVDRARTGAH